MPTNLREYEQAPGKCPNCENERYTQRSSHDELECYQIVKTCNKCNTSWTEVYELTAVIIEQGDAVIELR